MKFQYYHGTSDLFLESILEHGLGGLNPNFAYNHLETLRKLFELSEQHLMSAKDFRNIYDTTRAMSMQAKLRVNFQGKEEILNYKHDGIYIALSLQRAICYATLNRYGSEILTRSMELLDLLEKHQIDYYHLDPTIDTLVQLRSSELKPIIIKILNIDEDQIDKEDGKTAKEALDFLRCMMPLMTEKEKFELYQSCNFKLLKPVPSTDIEVFEVDFEGKYGQDDFEYTMTRIK